MKNNLLYTFLLAALATSCTDEGLKKQGGSSEQASGNGSKVYIQNFLQEPDSVDVQALVTRGVVETNPDANNIYQVKWHTDQVEEIDIYKVSKSDAKFLQYFTTVKLHPEFNDDNHSWAGYNSWFGESMEYVDYKPDEIYVAVAATKAYKRRVYSGNSYSRLEYDITNQTSYPEDEEYVDLNYDLLVSNLVEPKLEKNGCTMTQPDFHFKHAAALVKYNLYNLPADKKIKNVSIVSPNSSFFSTDDGKVYQLGFHTNTWLPLSWDKQHLNEDNLMYDGQDRSTYFSSSTSSIRIKVLDEEGAQGRLPKMVDSSDKYADYKTKLTTSFFATEAIFSDGLTRRTDALIVRAVAEDNSEYICVTSEDAYTYLPGYAYVRNLVMQPYNVTLAQTSGFVDLGLPSGTLWSAVNLGASNPQSSGNYYAWGEIETKSNYAWSNYQYGTSDNITKYSDADGKLLLDNKDDICEYINYTMSLPTRDQIRELVFKCQWQRVYYQGTMGSLVTGPNGNQIFIPYRGYKDGTRVLYESAGAYLWSKSFRGFDTGHDYYAGALHAFGDGKRNNYSYKKYLGLNVRPVSNPNAEEPEYNPADNPEPTYKDEHQYVDLGLPSGLLWATMNIGATEVAGSKINSRTGQLDCMGEFYAFGETKTKAYYSEKNYSSTVKSNCFSTSAEKTLSLTYDAARSNWGGSWRMPTKTECDELRRNCYFEYTSSYNGTGVEGYIVYKAKVEGDKGKITIKDSEKSTLAYYNLSVPHIFLPFTVAAYMSGSSSKPTIGFVSSLNGVNLWTSVSQRYNYSTYYATCFNVPTYYQYSVYVGMPAELGLPIRPVIKK